MICIVVKQIDGQFKAHGGREIKILSEEANFFTNSANFKIKQINQNVILKDWESTNQPNKTDSNLINVEFAKVKTQNSKLYSKRKEFKTKKFRIMLETFTDD